MKISNPYDRLLSSYNNITKTVIYDYLSYLIQIKLPIQFTYLLMTSKYQFQMSINENQISIISH